jgi:hypothetical protein
VDKTPLIAQLGDEGKYYFLSRPRRFGKSLLVSTLAEAFADNRALFAGRYLNGHWDCGRHRPVIRIDFGLGVIQDRDGLDRRIHRMLDLQAQAQAQGLRTPASPGPADALEELILALHQASGERVVVLVDEYDKPILDNVTQPERAAELRESLRNLYSVIKAQDAHLRFGLLTGVSKFSKVSLFSGLNNLEDISLDPRFATLCGYSQTELVMVFAERLVGVDLAEVHRWYNGYNFLGERVYRQKRGRGQAQFLLDLLHAPAHAQSHGRTATAHRQAWPQPWGLLLRRSRPEGRPCPAGAAIYQGAEPEAGRPLQLLRPADEQPIAQRVLPLHHRLCLQMPQPTEWEAQEFHLGNKPTTCAVSLSTRL